MYIDQSKTPYNYYLEALKSSIDSMAGSNNEAAERIYNLKLKEIDEANMDLPSVSLDPNNKERLIRTICYVSDFVFKDALAKSVTDEYGKYILTPAFGVEYYTYDFEGEFTTSKKPYVRNEYSGYYINARNMLWNKIKFQPNAIRNLTKPDSLGNYKVIDFKQLNNDLKKSFKYYYDTNPDMITNLSPDGRIQTIFGTVLGSLSASIVRDYNKTNNSTFNY